MGQGRPLNQQLPQPPQQQTPAAPGGKAAQPMPLGKVIPMLGGGQSSYPQQPMQQPMPQPQPQQLMPQQSMQPMQVAPGSKGGIGGQMQPLPGMPQVIETISPQQLSALQQAAMRQQMLQQPQPMPQQVPPGLGGKGARRR